MSPAPTRWIRHADRASLIGMGAGLFAMLAFETRWTFSAGFFLVLFATLAQILVSHLRGSDA